MTVPLMKLCLKIFICRIMDVSLGTVRTIQIVKGRRAVAACFGFCEVFLWFTVVRDALQSDEGGLIIALFYAAGYATGTLVGCLISDRFISRKLCVQIITSSRDEHIIHALRDSGYAVTVVEVMESEFSPAKFMLFVEINGRQMKALREQVKRIDEHAFIVVQESKTVVGGYFTK